VRGGNDQIPARLAEALSGQIKLGSEFRSIRRNSDGSYRLAFALAGGGTSTVTADRVVLALPFSILRTLDGFASRRHLSLAD
jgi:monoamine oxidase